jgi:hypothetical protein
MFTKYSLRDVDFDVPAAWQVREAHDAIEIVDPQGLGALHLSILRRTRDDAPGEAEALGLVESFAAHSRLVPVGAVTSQRGPAQWRVRRSCRSAQPDGEVPMTWLLGCVVWTDRAVMASYCTDSPDDERLQLAEAVLRSIGRAPPRLSPRQMQAVLALPASRRFEHFVKVVADRQQVWGLHHDGWALAAADDGTPVFPLWPAPDYAQACALGEWAAHAPRAIGLDDFIRALLPKLKAEGVLPGVFFTPAGRGLTPSVDTLQAALDAERENF